MKILPLKPLPSWVPGIGTTVEITPNLTPFLFKTRKTNHRAKVTSVGISDYNNVYWIKLEDFCYEIYLSEKEEQAWLNYNGKWLNGLHVAF